MKRFLYWLQKKERIEKKKCGQCCLTCRYYSECRLDGELDGAERMLAEEMLCGSREEHIALFGDAGDFTNSSDDSDLDCDMEIAGLDADELELINEDERRETLEDAGLDPDDYDFD